MLVAKGRFRTPAPVAAWRRDLLKAGLLEIPLAGDIAVAAVELDGFHADPAERFIVATAIQCAATLMTADGQILAWPGQLNRFQARS